MDLCSVLMALYWFNQENLCTATWEILSA